MEVSYKLHTFAPVKQKGHGRVAQLNRVADYGSAGYRFESCRDHLILCILCGGFYFFPHFIEEIGAQSENLGDCVKMAQSETLGDCVKTAQSETLGDCVKILIFAS